jgi:hypothetical protein
MAAIRISTGPRYQKTGSPSQKKAKRIAEIMALVMNEALTQPKRPEGGPTITRKRFALEK